MQQRSKQYETKAFLDCDCTAAAATAAAAACVVVLRSWFVLSQSEMGFFSEPVSTKHVPDYLDVIKSKWCLVVVLFSVL